jgi:multidrug efflux system membrane fusion protein
MSTENAPSRRHPLRTILIAGVLAGLIGGVWYWSDHRAQPATAAAGQPGSMRGAGGKHAQPVSVDVAKITDIRVWLNALGTVTPRNLVTVHAKVDGTLIKVNFREGQMVKAGQVLAEIDPRTFQIQLNQAEGQLTRDTALLDNARIDLARYQKLVAKDAIPSQQVDTQSALVRQYQGTVETDRGLVDNARLQLGWTHVTAESDGRIGLRQVDPGNQVHAADANGLATIAQLQPTTVLFSVPEANLPAINQHMAGNEAIQVEAWDSEQKNRLAEGRLLTTDNQIDPATGTIKIRAEFPNRDNTLFPNQFVNIRLLLDTLHQVVAVPSAAVLRGDKGSFVYRVDAGGTVASVPVTPGAVDGNWVAVAGGIKAGDKLVTDGTDKLRDGAKVEVIVAGANPADRGTQGSKHGHGATGGTPRSAAGSKHKAGSGATE